MPTDSPSRLLLSTISNPYLFPYLGFLFNHGNATMNQTQSSRLVDPFEEQTVFSLIPRTNRLSKDALKSKDREAIHQYMKSMALQSSDKHLEKAKSVVDGGSEFLKTKKSEVVIKEKANPKQQRPGLVRKPAKFSMKPDTSQPNTILEPTLKLDHLLNPEEFYAAYEKHENTLKELKRHRGGGADVDEVKTSTTVRKRRPEIPRRKVSYKHYEYSSQSQNDTSISQETLQDKVGSPPVQSSQQESLTTKPQSEEEEVIGSMAKSEKKAQKLFDELMASGIHNLDGNQAVSLIKDRLNIKPVEINDLKLPKFHQTPRVDFISPVKIIPQVSQTIFPDTSRVFPNVSKEKTPVTQKKLSDNVLQSLGLTPTPPKSPFMAISTLGKRMLQSLISKDPFSTHDIDSPLTTSNTVINGGSSHHASKDNEFPVSATLQSENKITETAIGDVEDVDCNMEERDVDDNETETDIQRNEDVNGNGNGNGNSEDMLEKAADVTEVDINDEDITEANVEDVTEKEGASSLPEVDVEVPEVEDFGQPDANSIEEDLDTSGPTQNLDFVQEQQNEEEHPSISTITKKRKKMLARKADRKKLRQSLAGAGSSWTSSGVRRSSRIKSKPLEFWKGERLLVARVHNSLPTVIGVKYRTPGKGGFKVESFVSDKYKHLVDLISRH